MKLKYQNQWEKFNTDFEGVINNCKITREDEEGTWITEDMKSAYIDLFKAGYAMSVETYLNEELVGGLYGVKIGKCFFGESMFSKVNNSSKIALITLAEKLKEENFAFIDCQVHTDHLESMGAKFVEWDEFKRMLNDYCSIFPYVDTQSVWRVINMKLKWTEESRKWQDLIMSMI